jgi:hypothetical protein
MVSVFEEDKTRIIRDLVMMCKLEAEEELQKRRVEFDNLVNNISDQSELNRLIQLRDRVHELEHWNPSLDAVLEKVKVLYNEHFVREGTEQ